MDIYVDANVLIALFVTDALTGRASASVSSLVDPLLISDVAALEFAAAVARKTRGGVISAKDGREALSNFDVWAGALSRVSVQSADVVAADAIVRRFDVNLNATDAVHVALAHRIGAKLLTLDVKMRANAKKVGLTVV